jgi:hypothetical protein
VSVRSVTKICFERYLDVVNKKFDSASELDLWTPEFSNLNKTSYYHIRWMCQVCLEHIEDWPVDKLSRWLGFIQGLLTTKSEILVDNERSFSRKLFHEAYTKDNIIIPETLEYIKK